jgi:hypothetical protein
VSFKPNGRVKDARGNPEKRVRPGMCDRQLFSGSPFLLVRFLLAMQKKMNKDTEERSGLMKFISEEKRSACSRSSKLQPFQIVDVRKEMKESCDGSAFG